MLVLALMEAPGLDLTTHQFKAVSSVGCANYVHAEDASLPELHINSLPCGHSDYTASW